MMTTNTSKRNVKLNPMLSMDTSELKFHLSWVELPNQPKLSLLATCEYGAGSIKTSYNGLTEAILKPIGDWCEVNNCGARTSWDIFEFKSSEEMHLFLLRWT